MARILIDVKDKTKSKVVVMANRLGVTMKKMILDALKIVDE
jgi:hypothetical protein